tara:strand:- start:154954 stop:156120 length:1167 start_codon:yes stop_codon:yes gene_type:complete
MVRTPLAWKNLSADWRRLLLASGGVGFAAMLMFMQNGFRNALLDSPVQLVHSLDGDLIAISSARYSLASEQSFPRHLLDRARSDPEVAEVTPIYVELSRAQIRVVGKPRRPIRVIGTPLQSGLFRDEQIDRNLSRLSQPRTALLDRHTRRTYGFSLDDPESLSTQSVELLGRSMRVVAAVDVGTDFANDGTVIVSDRSFAEYFYFRGAGKPLSVVDLAVIRTREGADPQDVAARLTALQSDQWTVYPRQVLIDREIDFWNKQTPIGMIFFIGAMMGFAVGVIICYQILFTSIHDSMSEFATLKAMGYPNSYFVGLVIRQSIYLSLAGFIPALIFSFAMFQLIEAFVGLPMLLTLPRVALVLALTVTMCLISGLLALRKLISADPASLF